MAKAENVKIDLHLVRNFGTIAHIDAGKTTTSERMLYFTGKTHKVGEVHEGAATMDYLAEEKARGVTIVSAATTCFWTKDNEKYRLNLIDTPGHVDFTAEVERSLRILDGACVIFDGKTGVQAQTETVWRQADKYNVPRICFVNKLNIIGGDFYASLKSIQERLSRNAVALALPIGLEDQLHGLVDLLDEKAYFYKDINQFELEEGPIPEDMKLKVHEYRNILIEKIVEFDDKLMELYLEGKEIPVAELKKTLRKATVISGIFPVLGGDSRGPITRKLLDTVVDYLPSPFDVPPVEGTNPKTKETVVRKPDEKEPLAALVFKVVSDEHVGTLSYVRVYSGVLKPGTYVWNSTKNEMERVGRVLLIHAAHREEVDELRAGEIGGLVGMKKSVTGDTLSDQANPAILENIQFAEPVVSASIFPITKQDSEKMADVLAKVQVEDPTIKVKVDPETAETIIMGMGQFHLQIWTERMASAMGLQTRLGEPKVAYRESIGTSVKMEGKFVRQSGGKGQYGHCWLRLEPQERGVGFEFVDEVKGGAIPREYIPAVRKGVEEALQAGVVAGYPVVDVKVAVYDGSYHDVDSSEAAFKVAGAQAFKDGQKAAQPYLLEPIMKIEVMVPDQYLGEVTGLLNSKRAQIQGANERAGLQVIIADIPLSETFDFTTRLRASTSGRGSSYMEFSHYDRVPNSLVAQLVQNAK
ncbi:MAG: elongation factor G [Patescibacteria group bacterium]